MSHPTKSVILILSVLITLTGCANSSNQKDFEKMLAPDPQLQAEKSPTPVPNPTVTPTNFPVVSTPNPTPTPITFPPPENTPNFTPSSPIPSPSPSTLIPLPSNPIVANPTNSNIPEALQQFVSDLEQLGVLNLSPNLPSNNNNPTFLDQPEKNITRREFVRWLIAANNRIYADNPSRQIRLATPNSVPAFQDVPANDPDFLSIQALAEAGLIPSSLSGNNKKVNFRPDDMLTREQMLMWKVPIDKRKALSIASLDAVKQKWGFMDADQITDKALGAILADADNGDRANIRRVFGFTTLLQPQKNLSRAEAAAALWFFGDYKDGKSAKDALNRARKP